MKTTRFALYALFTAFILAAVGCVTHAPNPLEGWHFVSLKEFDANKEIKDDYEAYAQSLTAKKEEFIGTFDYLEDGSGQHAIDIKVGVNGTWWEHVLIYNKENKRIKVIKYRNGGYRS